LRNSSRSSANKARAATIASSAPTRSFNRMRSANGSLDWKLSATAPASQLFPSLKARAAAAAAAAA
jgi:hypothetical protein